MTQRFSWHLAMTALSLAALLAAGCGSSSFTPAGPTNSISGSTTQASGTSPAVTVPATGGATTVVTVGGQSVGATVPSGAPSPTAGQTVAVIDLGSELISGTFVTASSVTVNGVANSGVTVDGTGALLQNVALPIAAGTGTAYSLVFPSGSVHGRALSVSSWTLSGKFYIIGGVVVSPVPTKLSGTIPNNGEDPTGSTVVATFGTGNVGRTAKLTIYYSTDHVNGLSLSQTVTIGSTNTAQFNKLGPGGGNIPSTGVDSIVLAVGDIT